MAKRVASILDELGCLALPGVFDALSARLAEQAGFPMGFVSGYSVAATTLGLPDFGLLTQTEIVDQARKICRAVETPILIDADTGYGNALNVRRTVEDLIAAGAAGCFLEDQVWPKRCGHMQGKSVIDAEQYAEKIAAANEARRDADFFIVARTDSLAIHGIDEAKRRVIRARSLGADASFIEAPQSREELQAIGAMAGPNVANMIHGGKTPILEKAELAKLGFHLILHPLCGLYSAVAAMRDTFAELREQGASPPAQVDFAEFNQLIDLPRFLELDRQYQNPRPRSN